MRRKRAKQNVLDKRIVPVLVVSILIFVLMISPFTKPLGAKAAVISEVSKGKHLTVTKSVEPINDEEREFQVILNLENTLRSDADDTKLYDVSITDVVNNEFMIESGSVVNADVNENTVTKSFDSIAYNTSKVISYKIKAKDNVSGYKTINTEVSKFSYSYKEDNGYWWLGWHSKWVTKNESVNINSPTIYVKPKNIDVPDPEAGKVTLNKSAVKTADGQYRISFDVAGKIQKADPKQADIVVVIDKSTSMSYDSSGASSGYDNSRIKAVKKSVKLLAEDVLGNASISKGGNIRIAIASFSDTATTNLNFSSSVNDINKAVGDRDTGIMIYKNQGTNTEAGIKMAGKLLDDSKKDRPDAIRFVVMFTDGLPTLYLAGKENTDNNVQGPGNDSPDACFGYAQEEYNRVIGGITSYGGIGRNNRDYYYYSNAGTVKNPPKPRHADAKFYSIGFTSNNTNNTNMMTKFLSSTQNVMKIEKDSDIVEFTKKYCTASTAAIEKIFGDITTQIKQSISSIVDNATITDVISDEFVIPKNVADTIKLSVNGTAVTKTDVLNSIVKSVQGQNIILDLSKVPQEIDKNDMVKISVSFIVKVRDEYFSGNGINTNNGNAKLHYTDPKDKKTQKDIEVKSPTVDIAPVEGTIYIEKSVDLKGIEKAEKTEKDFPIYLIRKSDSSTVSDGKESRYGFNVTANSSVAMNFYLRGKSTDITKINNASVTSKNYITAGTYKVSELVPMDYSNVSIQYSYDNKDWKTEDTFEITKQHNKVYLRVTNNLDNNTYWRDSSNSHNEFEMAK